MPTTTKQPPTAPQAKTEQDREEVVREHHLSGALFKPPGECCHYPGANGPSGSGSYVSATGRTVVRD